MAEDSKARRFKDMVLPHLDAAYNLARWLCRSDQDAEDIVQEACLRAYRFFDGFHGERARPWLLAIVRNTCFTWLTQNRPSSSTVRLMEEAHDTEARETTDGPGQSESPETLLARNDDRRLINEALDQLPVEFREALVLRELEDLSYREIAQVTSTPIGTVMSRLARGRKLLLLHLKKEAGDGL